jgi:8-oxo-dGTP diphosphatase
MDDAGTTGGPYARPICAVIAVVARGREILLVRRASPPDEGLWGFPGGKIEFAEPILRAAGRELLEETGVVAAPERVIDAIDVFQRRIGGVERHFVLIAVACRYVSGEPVAADDALEARWFRVDDLGSSSMELSADVERIAILSLQ